MSNKTLKFRMLPLGVAIAGVLGTLPALAQEGEEKKAEDEIEIIQVSGIRSSLTKSMELKQNAPSIQDSIVAEDIGKFPDQNVAESLQRISGVSISRVNGEGSKVTVRGFGPKFNAVKLNDRTIATTDRGREFDFQVLPSELISGADVIKASRANISEGSLGAYVNINTARPLDTPGMHSVASVDVVYNDLSEEYDPKYTGIYSNTFADDTIGVLFGLSYLETNNRIDAAGSTLWAQFDASNTDYAPGPVHFENGDPMTSGAVWYPGRATYSMDDEKRERTSANMTLQYATDSDFVTTFDFLYSDLSRQAVSNGMQVPLQHSGWKDVIVSENQTALAATKDASPIDGLFQERGQDSETFAYGLNSIYYNDQWIFEVDLSYSNADSEPVSNTFVPHFVNHTVDQSVMPGDPGYMPNQDLGLVKGQDNIKFDSRNGDILGITSTIDFANPASVRAHWNDIRHTELEDEIKEAKFNTTFEFESGMVTSIEGGIAYSDREKSSKVYLIENGCSDTSIEDPVERAKTNTCGTSRDMDDSLFSVNSGNGFLSDVGGNFPRDFVLVNNIDDFKSAIGDLRGQPNWDDEFLSETDTVENTEETLALFAQANLEGEFDAFRWSGNIGLRYVDTETSSSGHGKERLSIAKFVDPTRPDSTDGIILDVEYTEPGVLEVEKDYQKYLPSVNISADFGDGYYIKTAAAKVISRPSLEDTGVNRNYSDVRAEDFRTTGGNPYLDPYEANQYDLSFEYYGEAGDAYALNFFYKDIENFISTITFQEDTNVDIDGWGRLYETITQKDNRSGGTIKGVEVAGLHYFDYLPGWASGFGIQANYTYTDSEDDNADVFEQDGVQAPSSGLEGFSKHAYNIIAFYDKDAFQARVAYNWRDDYLQARQGVRTNGLPEHVEAYGQFDANMSYEINEMFTIKAEAINLTNEEIVQYADVRERVSLVQYSGRRYLVGVTAKF